MGLKVIKRLNDVSVPLCRSLLQNGMYALDRMPSSACPLMILVTDGVLGLPANRHALAACFCDSI